MKRFATFFMAAILGSLCTIGAVEYFKKDEVALSYMAETPVQKVSYTHDETGREVPLDFTAIAEKATPAVVFIKSKQSNSNRSSEIPEELRQFFGYRGPSGPSVSSGSGVIISEGGYIVTNNHVVEDADAVEVTLNDNRTFQAEIIGTDPDTDLALIKINATGLKYMSFVNSDHSRVGEWVVAVGNPFNLTSTVTAGIISAKSRNINIINRQTEEGNVGIESFIQTDAAINPGNSGGALVDMTGGLLGINTAIASNTGSYNGYGFAVPSNIVSKVVEDLIKFGAVQRGWLGVSITSVNSDLVKAHALEVNEGAYVSTFAEKSSAKAAGVKEGDVIVKINDAPIRSSSALIETVGSHRPGDKLNITVNRAGKEITIPVVLKNRDGNEETIKREEKSGYASLGVTLEEVNAKELKALNLTNGVKIKSLENGKLSRFTDVREGFIVTKINDKPVKTVRDFNETMKSKNPGDLVILTGTYADLPREYIYAFKW
ncbi:MAG: Do family serine endopeptidase [Cyclobacteriaceae bacterium]|nr:Do family serine endopeptidase [Cyclobacteriaceae bacterium]